MTELIDAIWQGPFDAHVGWPPAVLQPGDEYQVSEQDLQSTHWRRKTPIALATSSASSASKPAGTTTEGAGS